MSIDSSKELKEIYDGMIEDGTGLYDVIKIIGEAFYYTEQLESENARLRQAIEDVRHKGYCATVKHVCKGIEIEKGVFSGCAGLSDCPECNGVKHTCSCGIDDWKDSVLNNNRNALEKP